MSKPVRTALLAAVLTLVGGSTLLCGVTWRFGSDLLRVWESDEPSRAVGTRSGGHLVHGKRLPTSGANFVTYSFAGSTLGRTAVHSRVRDTLLAAWAELETTQPDVVWMYGETAWPGGGDFYPHRTHQHGLSVDHMVPVRSAAGASTRLPCRAWNALCYTLHADSSGRFDGGATIDFEALAALVDAVDRHGRDHGVRLRLVILQPDLQDELAQTALGSRVRRRVPFSSKRSWVQHDNHIHMDFEVR